jgi:hypothetical protein
VYRSASAAAAGAEPGLVPAPYGGGSAVEHTPPAMGTKSATPAGTAHGGKFRGTKNTGPDWP